MAGALVDRATSDLLIGPDWARNIEICNILNHEPGQVKEAVKDLKRRIGHKNSKVQLLALTLLETMIKNCGDIVHMHVAEKDILHEMVKIVKKKHSDFHVKVKILILIDTWQEAFGGPRARYPQFYAAYEELLRAGVVFPPRSKRSAPIFTPPQTKPLQSYSPSVRGPGYQNEARESSVASDFPILSLTEIQNARGIMDVLADMLNALDPGNRDEIKQEVIVELVCQCHIYRQKVVHLVNMTSDEELLSQGLALNDDLQKVLAKHDAIAAGVAAHVEKRKSLQALVDVDSSASKEPDQRVSTTSTSTNNQPPLQQLLLPPPSSNGSATSSSKVDPNRDLLSGDYDEPATENLLALVAVGEPLTDSASDQNILVLADMFPPNNSNSNSMNPAHSFDSNSSFPTKQTYPAGSNLQLQAQQTEQPALFTNGGIPNSGAHQFEQARLDQTSMAWNGQLSPTNNPQQQALGYAADNQGGALPPPPWEVQPAADELLGLQPQPLQSGQLGGMSHQSMPGSQLRGMHPQHMLGTTELMWPQHQLAQNSQFAAGMSPPTQNGQMTAINPQQMFGGNDVGLGQQSMQVQLTGYGYVQRPDDQFYDPTRTAYPYSTPNELLQRMYGLSVQANSTYAGTSSSYQTSTSMSSLPSRPEDMLFGDLVSMAKTKQIKPTVGKVESL